MVRILRTAWETPRLSPSTFALSCFPSPTRRHRSSPSKQREVSPSLPLKSLTGSAKLIGAKSAAGFPPSQRGKSLISDALNWALKRNFKKAPHHRTFPPCPGRLLPYLLAGIQHRDSQFLLRSASYRKALSEVA